MKAQELLKKYNIIPNHFYGENEHPYLDFEKRIQKLNYEYEGEGYPPNTYYESPEYIAFKTKWIKRIEPYAPGIFLGQPCPLVFYQILDEFLDYVWEICPKFSIYKIDINRGVLRLVINNITNEIREDVNILCDNLYDEKLIR